MAGLLVSVRSPDEARAALVGGASVIDVKEPDLGPLGRAEPDVWQAVRQAVPPGIPVSVALGELLDWRERPAIVPEAFAGITYRKLGLAGCGRLPASEWAAIWRRLRQAWGAGPAWVAVVYADWERASAPSPDAVVAVALAAGCAGVLIDTWDKMNQSPINLEWEGWIRQIQRAGLFVALAGGLGAAEIARLAPLKPELFAVRGAACSGGNRRAAIDAERVAGLVRVLDRTQGTIRIGAVGRRENTLDSSAASASFTFQVPSACNASRTDRAPLVKVRPVELSG
jgi:(5-formylfuran-3-yl)methyl phosphate synthase